VEYCYDNKINPNNLYWKPKVKTYFQLGRDNWLSINFEAPVSIVSETQPIKLDMNTIQSKIIVYNIKGQLIQEVKNISFASCHTLDLPQGTYIGMANNMVHKFKK